MEKLTVLGDRELFPIKGKNIKYLWYRRKQK